MEVALATYTEEAVRSVVIASVQGAAHELLAFIGYSEEMDVIIRHIKEHFGQGPEGIFPDGAAKIRKYQPVH